MIVGICLANISHGAAVGILYCLSRSILKGPDASRVAFVAACLHIISPAGIFLSAPYAESPFALLVFSASLLFSRSISAEEDGSARQDLSLVVSGALFGIATTFRSNGLLNGLLYIEEALRLLHKCSQKVTFPRVRRLVAVGIGGSGIGAGFIFPQYIAYQSFCKNEGTLDGEVSRDWCTKPLPSIYTFVQDHYWSVPPWSHAVLSR